MQQASRAANTAAFQMAKRESNGTASIVFHSCNCHGSSLASSLGKWMLKGYLRTMADDRMLFFFCDMNFFLQSQSFSACLHYHAHTMQVNSFMVLRIDYSIDFDNFPE